jgi:hypothetical protein
MKSQYFIRTIPERTSIRSQSGTVIKNSSTSSAVQKSHHTFDTGSVVPAPIEENDLASGGQVRNSATSGSKVSLWQVVAWTTGVVSVVVTVIAPSLAPRTAEAPLLMSSDHVLTITGPNRRVVKA